MAEFNNTKEWDEYESGQEYNTKLNYYSKTDLNWRFFNDKQWIGIVDNGLPKYTLNICKSAINYFIAFICSQKIKMQYSSENMPDETEDPQELKVKEFTQLLSGMAELKWEKDKIDSKLRKLMLDGGVSGDFAAHVYWNPNKETGQDEKGDFETEIVDGVNIMFGNPNNPIVEKQPYILVLGRDLVEILKLEAEENGVSKEFIDTIQPDDDNTHQAGQYGKVELQSKVSGTGKCNYIIKYWKDKYGEVFWNKSTKSCPIIKNKKLGMAKGEHIEETKITLYPVAWGNWETIKNSYHGNPAIEGIIDNQIGINQLFAMVAYWMKKCAFGNMIVDGAAFPDGISNKLGQVHKTNGGQPVRDVVYQLEAGNFNAAILSVIDMAIKYTKDFVGANDNLTGNINAEQASGIAIIASGKQAAIPLGNISAARDQFVEDLGLIWGQFFLKKYNSRKVGYKKDGKIMAAPFDSSSMRNILLNCMVDVGPSSFYNEISGIQTLDGLLKAKEINKLQYFERMAKMNVIPDCQGLIKDAQAEMAMLQQQAQQQQAMQQQQIQGQQQMQQDQQNQQSQQQEAETQKAMQFMDKLPEQVQQKIADMGEQSLPFTLKLMQLQDNELAKTITEFMRGG